MSSTKLVCCRNAVEADIDCVARLHLAAFDGFFLSQLGFRFLCVMYRAFLKSPSSLFVVFETSSGQLAGFAVGALQGQNDRRIAIRYLPQFILSVIPAILENPSLVVKRLWARFFDFSKSPPVPYGAAILRSIGVLPSVRGAGVAHSLLHAFEILAHSKGAGHVFLTTDEINNERAKRFYKRGGYILVCRFMQDRGRVMCLMSKDLKGSVLE